MGVASRTIVARYDIDEALGTFEAEYRILLGLPAPAMMTQKLRSPPETRRRSINLGWSGACPFPVGLVTALTGDRHDKSRRTLITATASAARPGTNTTSPAHRPRRRR